jgi:hypothetical protein
LVKREKPITRWDALGDEFAERISDAYAQFPIRRFDTIGLHADQVVNAILAVDTEGATCGADTEILGGRADVLPAVSRRVEAAEMR